MTGRQQRVTGEKVLSGLANMARRRLLIREGDGVTVAVHVFLNDDMVCTLGHNTAGENADGFAAFNGAPKSATCGCFTNYGECGLSVLNISESNGVAIHSRHVTRRLCALGDNRLCQHPARGIPQRDIFRLGQGRGLGQRSPGLINRNHVASRLKSPDLPPVFSTNSISVMRASFSIALTMS